MSRVNAHLNKADEYDCQGKRGCPHGTMGPDVTFKVRVFIDFPRLVLTVCLRNKLSRCNSSDWRTAGTGNQNVKVRTKILLFHVSCNDSQKAIGDTNTLAVLNINRHDSQGR